MRVAAPGADWPGAAGLWEAEPPAITLPLRGVKQITSTRGFTAGSPDRARAAPARILRALGKAGDGFRPNIHFVPFGNGDGREEGKMRLFFFFSPAFSIFSYVRHDVLTAGAG